MNDEKDKNDMLTHLTNVYYDPRRSGGLGGVERLYNDIKKEGKYDVSKGVICTWLMGEDTYTLHKPARRRFKRNRVITGGIDDYHLCANHNEAQISLHKWEP